ncbi:hypothetical protein CA223_00015 [Sphingomonas koreensis]|jgi:hypothetical protein|uniref:Uncharacterized protein n=1 Tax=Sphingomonas koreensis TaxID=93064 RepID=A0A1L6JFH6_9SPHN|nr:hypothetical protein [Sphingomonas koreensis]APR54655.1 hypothetical protein BRX40_21470 [Sphingomonas koreensis]MDC7810765.1 hypothetical protein [Sphingomonas koreensis]RSU20371.1 hypothetical protein CA224_09835 [Sphingomonas koreensis]RSU28932.1 hypothetical protein CA225_09610 [Sphingomonas koreensis]RSU29554.1 hypothetical protein CA222_02815 [Sphingomonas koreensis]
MMLGLAALPLPAGATQREVPEPEASPPVAPCVIVEVGGTRSGDLECAARQAARAAKIARAQADAIRTLSAVRAGSPDIRVGVTSLSGTRLRMGSNLGVSARPARPAAAPVTPMGRQP